MVRKRILAAMPLISVLLFLVAGLYLDNWKLGWSFFLLIPLSWVLLNPRSFRRISEITPFLCLIVFLWIGFGLGKWHPGWIVFLMIPLVNMLVEKRISAQKIVSLTITAAFIAIGLIFNSWHPTWIMLLLIPIINTIFFPRKYKVSYINTFNIRDKIRNIINQNQNDDTKDDE